MVNTHCLCCLSCPLQQVCVLVDVFWRFAVPSTLWKPLAGIKSTFIGPVLLSVNWKLLQWSRVTTLFLHKLAMSFEKGFKKKPNQNETTKPKPLVAKLCPEFEDNLLWKWWLQFLSVSVHLPSRPDDWVLTGFWTLFWLHFCMHSGSLNCRHLQVPGENGTPCSVRLDYSEIIATYSACNWRETVITYSLQQRKFTNLGYLPEV